MVEAASKYRSRETRGEEDLAVNIGEGAPKRGRREAPFGILVGYGGDSSARCMAWGILVAVTYPSPTDATPSAAERIKSANSAT